jgi:tRNA-modifying protein YgfZ
MNRLSEFLTGGNAPTAVITMNVTSSPNTISPNTISNASSTAALTPGYDALRASAAWIDLSGRGKIRMTGDDRVRLLHAMATQHVHGIKPGGGAYTFFLNAQGRILADANIFGFEDHFLLDTEPETRQKLVEHLDRFIIADDVTLEDVTDSVATIAIEGPAAADVLARLGAPVPAVPFGTAAWNEKIIARVSSTGGEGFFVFLPTAVKDSFLSSLQGIPQATAEDARIVRLEHAHPRYGDEISERYLVQETAQLHAVHFSKGCYLGQEIVERVRSRAQIHRILRRLEIEGATPPEPGTKIKSGDADAAEIASAAYSPGLGKVVAIAYVRTPFAEPGTEIASESFQGRVS